MDHFSIQTPKKWMQRQLARTEEVLSASAYCLGTMQSVSLGTRAQELDVEGCLLLVAKELLAKRAPGFLLKNMHAETFEHWSLS